MAFLSLRHKERGVYVVMDPVNLQYVLPSIN